MEVGCQDDRECIALTGSPLATCVAGECQEPCEKDADCFSTSGTQVFSFAACVEGACTDVGCKTDEECKILLTLAGNQLYEARCLPKER